MILLHKSLAYVFLFEDRNHRLSLHQGRVLPYTEFESPAYDGEFAIDCSVGCTGGAATGDILPHLRLAEPGSQQAAQHGRDVRLVSPLYVPHITQIAQSIVFHHQIAEIRNRGVFGARPHTAAPPLLCAA